jgi:hypothetical protein
MTTRVPVNHLSPSHLWLFRTCLRACEYVYAKHYPRLTNAKAAAGTATHASAEQDFRSMIERKALLPDAQIEAVAADAWEREAFTVDWLQEDETKGAYKDKVVAMATRHHKVVAPTILPIGVEVEMECPFDGDLVLTGRADVISESKVEVVVHDNGDAPKTARRAGRHIRDTKTKQTAPHGVKSGTVEHGVHELCQQATYRLIQSANKTPAVQSFIDYLWCSKKEGAHSFSAPVELSKRDVQLALDDYRDLIVMYEKGLFPRSGRGSWFCKEGTCPGYAECILGRAAVVDR